MRVQGHSYKPEPRMFGKDKYHLGVELEVEAPNSKAREGGLNITERPVYCYAKHDGSLSDNGWELVTHPIAKWLWMDAARKSGAAKRFFSLVQGLREMGYTSHGNEKVSSCGLHIHVSLSAFFPERLPLDNMPLFRHLDYSGRVSPKIKKCRHLYWFSRIVNTNLFRRLSQRKDVDLNQWSRILPVSASNFFESGAKSRYVATNVGPHTVEVRIFRGNMREDRIRKALESVIAAVEYSKGLPSVYYKQCQEKPATLTLDFLEYIKKNCVVYPNLHSYLVEIGQIAATKEEKEVCA